MEQKKITEVDYSADFNVVATAAVELRIPRSKMIHKYKCDVCRQRKIKVPIYALDRAKSLNIDSATRSSRHVPLAKRKVDHAAMMMNN